MVKQAISSFCQKQSITTLFNISICYLFICALFIWEQGYNVCYGFGVEVKRQSVFSFHSVSGIELISSG